LGTALLSSVGATVAHLRLPIHFHATQRHAAVGDGWDVEQRTRATLEPFLKTIGFTRWLGLEDGQIWAANPSTVDSLVRSPRVRRR
jgi:hypothetical protein